MAKRKRKAKAEAEEAEPAPEAEAQIQEPEPVQAQEQAAVVAVEGGAEAPQAEPSVLVTDAPKVLAAVLTAAGELIEEATIKVDPENGLTLQSLDAAKIAMIQIFIPPHCWTEVQAPEDGAFYGLPLTDMVRVIKRIKGDERLTVTFTPNDVVLKVVGAFTKTHQLALLPPEEFEVRSLKVNFTAGIRMDPKVLPEIIRELKSVGVMEIKISIDGNETTFSAKSERKETSITLSRTDPVVLDMWAEDGPVKAYFSINYLERFVPAFKAAAEVKIDLASDKPMKITLPLKDGGTIVYYLANVAYG